MKFRPCIDIHNGKVKQIVGGSLKDSGSFAKENFVSKQDGAYYSKLYRSYGLDGGHIILLNPVGTPEYEADIQQARSAIEAFPGGLQIGGGINSENAAFFLEMGASHVIVTSYVFKNGRLNEGNLKKLIKAVGKDKLVLDLSCRRRDDKYYIVTDRWQKFTDIELNRETIESLSGCCDELLIHAVDSEGLARGIEEKVAEIMSGCNIPVTYAGGISSFEDIDKLCEIGCGRIDFTVGSALDIFGGCLPFEKIAQYRGRE